MAERKKEKKQLHVDMSQFSGPDAKWLLLGAPEGFRGHGRQPSALAEFARIAQEEGAVIDINKLEQANPEILDILFEQDQESGNYKRRDCITDNNGVTVPLAVFKIS